MLAGLLIIGGLGFYVFLGLLTIVMWAALENEKHFLATLSMVAAFVLFSFLGGCNVFAFTLHNLPLMLTYALVYVVAGLFWSIAKWWFYVRGRVDKLLELRAEFLEGKKLPSNTPWTDELQKDFNSHCYAAAELARRPVARKNKSKILAWMVYWPWSLTWTMINDPIMKLFRALFKRFHGLFEAISKSAYKGIST
jgi:hypothetical protein